MVILRGEQLVKYFHLTEQQHTCPTFPPVCSHFVNKHTQTDVRRAAQTQTHNAGVTAVPIIGLPGRGGGGGGGSTLRDD